MYTKHSCDFSIKTLINLTFKLILEKIKRKTESFFGLSLTKVSLFAIAEVIRAWDTKSLFQPFMSVSCMYIFHTSVFYHVNSSQSGEVCGAEWWRTGMRVEKVISYPQKTKNKFWFVTDLLHSLFDWNCFGTFLTKVLEFFLKFLSLLCCLCQNVHLSYSLDVRKSKKTKIQM